MYTQKSIYVSTCIYIFFPFTHRSWLNWRGTCSLCRRHTTHAKLPWVHLFLVSILWFCLSSRPPFPISQVQRRWGSKLCAPLVSEWAQTYFIVKGGSEHKEKSLLSVCTHSPLSSAGLDLPARLNNQAQPSDGICLLSEEPNPLGQTGSAYHWNIRKEIDDVLPNREIRESKLEIQAVRNKLVMFQLLCMQQMSEIFFKIVLEGGREWSTKMTSF